MIKKLKRKFVLTTMSCVLVIFVILLAALNIFFSVNLTQTSDSLIHALVDDKNIHITDIGGKPSEEFRRQPDGEQPRELSPMPETRNSMRYFITEYDSNWNVISTDVEQIATVSESDANDMANAITKTADGKIRWSGDYRYVCSKTTDGYKAVFLNCEFVRYSLNSLRLYSFLIAIISYMIIFLIIMLVSGRVIRPVAETYEKQKRFITDASHELKTPLTIISANNELQELNGNKSESTITISEEVEKMTVLVNELVSLARYDEEKTEVVRNDFALSEAVFDTASAFEGVAKNNNKHMTISIQPDIIFDGDEGMVRRLVSILTDNAVKYCDAGGDIAVTLKKGKHIELVVTNSYENVGNIRLEHLFDRFYCEDKARTSGNGYGLGLSIAKSIVKLHHGNIKAKSINNDTIEFLVSL